MVVSEWHYWFVYDETSPSCLRWKVDKMWGSDMKMVRCPAGSVVGSTEVSGYWVVKFNYKTYKCHRIIWEMLNGPLETNDVIDHIDRSKGNNSITNLRKVTAAENARNQKVRSNTKFKVGVQRSKTAYIATWYEIGATRQSTKRFSIAKYGEEFAFKLASEYRDAQIARMNQSGANYSDLHGKE